jgi:adenylate cyclase
LRRFDDAMSAINRLNHLFWWDHCYLAVCHIRLGQMEAAEREIARALSIWPTATIEDLMKGEPYKNAEDADVMVQGMRQAGLPE